MRTALLALCLLAACKAQSPTIGGTFPKVMVAGTQVDFQITGAFGGMNGEDVRVLLNRTRDLGGRSVSEPPQTLATGTLANAPVQQLTITMTLPDDVATGVYSVLLAAATGQVSAPDAFVVLPKPLVDSLDQTVLCRANTMPWDPPAQLRLLGKWLPVIDRQTPQISFLTPGGNFPSSDPEGKTMARCTDVDFAQASVQLCDEIDLGVPPITGDAQVAVSFARPAPADLTFSLPLLVDTPVRYLVFQDVYGYSTADGSTAITYGAEKVHAGPSSAATIDGQQVEPQFTNCKASIVAGESWCDAVSIPLAQGLPAGAHPYAFSSMDGCTATGTAHVVDPPQVTSVDPPVICGASSVSQLVIHGSGFANPRVFLDDVEAAVAGQCVTTDAWQGCGQFSIWSEPKCDTGVCGTFATGSHTLWVQSSTIPPAKRAMPDPLVVEPGPPAVILASPSTVYSGLDRDVFVTIRNQTGDVSSVEFAPYSSTGTQTAAKAIAPAAGGETVTVPAGLAVGFWQFVVHDGSTHCPGTGGTLHITDSFVAYSENFEEPSPNFSVVLDGQFTSTVAPELVAGDGGGTAAHYAGAVGGPAWRFAVVLTEGYDLATARFDLRRTGTGDATTLADLSIRAFNLSFSLEASLSPAPQDAWTHYDVALDDPAGWTYRGSDGSTRAATAADLRAAIDHGAYLAVLGSAFTGTTDATIDNISVELAH